MKKVRLLNTSEYLTEQTLRKVLDGTRFRVFAQLPLDKVIQPESNETLSKGERSLLQSSELDFIVYDEASEPQFAVEFDGPAHRQYDDQRRRDLRKNRLCYKAGLPLLRVTDIHLKEHDKTTLLEYIVSRFVAWDNERRGIEAEIEDELSRLSDNEIERLTRDGIADPTIDPTFRFDIRHPFPGTKETAKRLLDDYGIITPHVPISIWMNSSQRERGLRLSPQGMHEGSNGYDFVVSKEYELVEETRDKDHTTSNRLQIFRSAFSIQWCLLLEDDYDQVRETPLQYKMRTGNWPIAYQQIPGISMPELVENMCEFLVLSQVEEWVRRNLSKVVRAG